jgi:DNA polymerase I
MVRSELESFDEVWLVRLHPVCAAYVPGPGAVVRLTELRSGRTAEVLTHGPRPTWSPPLWGERSLCVVFDGSSTFGHFRVWGWPLPPNVIDLHAEYRREVAGLEPKRGYGWDDACQAYGVGPADPQAIVKLFARLAPTSDLVQARLRGRYTVAAARMESEGIPIDVPVYNQIAGAWEDLRSRLVGGVHAEFGVYPRGRLDRALWAAWLRERQIPWPDGGDGDPCIRVETFSEMAGAYPGIRPVKELEATLAQFRPFALLLGPDGRCRCPLRPFAAKTSRNQPPTSQFLFGRATWVRSLIRPPRGSALAYLDYSQQEFAIAAGLSRDPAMRDAYESGDPYLAFAQQAGAAPGGATKATHSDVREAYKQCVLGVQFGMGARSLALRLNGDIALAEALIAHHKRTYPRYWKWAKRVWREAIRAGQVQTDYGWTLRVGPESNRRSVRNFPTQAAGAEILRAVCIGLTEAGVRVCAPVHDAILVEAAEDRIDRTVVLCREVMEEVARRIARGIRVRVGSSVVRWPDRLTDPRGAGTWNTVCRLLKKERWSV